MNGYESKSVTVNFKVTGTPKPEVTWYHDGVLLDASSDFATFTDSSLTLSELILADAGMYQAYASNGYGSADISFELLVLNDNSKYQMIRHLTIS